MAKAVASNEEVEVTPASDPTPDQDVERILPGPGEPLTLSSGITVEVKPLKLRGFLSMLKIITRGAAVALGGLRLDTNDEDFVQNMLSLFIFAIPEADDEVIDFVRVMVAPWPKDSDGDPLNSGLLQDKSNELWAEFDDPELEDIFSVIEVIIHREGSDLRRLGKRMASALAFAQKTGQA
jgi:hypothetical protein